MVETAVELVVKYILLPVWIFFSPNFELYWSLLHDDLDTARTTIAQRDIDPNYTGRIPPLTLAAYNPAAEDIIRSLLALNARPDLERDRGLTPLMVASGRNNIAIMRILLEHRADPNLQDSFGTTAFTEAAAYGRLEACRLLLDHDADPNIGDPLNIFNLVPGGLPVRAQLQELVNNNNKFKR